MTTMHSVGSRSLSPDTQSAQIQHYTIAAVAIVFALVIIRIVVLRRRQRTLSGFFRMGGSSQYPYNPPPPMESNYNSMYNGIQLTPLPAAYRSDRRVRAADTDAHGRRLDPTVENWDGKDALPAYDNFDRPPKYVEAGWAHGRPPPLAEQSTVAPTPEGEQSGTTHSNPTNGTHTHTVAGTTNSTEAISPHGLSGS